MVAGTFPNSSSNSHNHNSFTFKSHKRNRVFQASLPTSNILISNNPTIRLPPATNSSLKTRITCLPVPVPVRAACPP